MTGEFCWRYYNADGKITATSAGGFPSRQDAHKAIDEFTRETGIGWDQQGDPFDPAIIDVDE